MTATVRRSGPASTRLRLAADDFRRQFRLLWRHARYGRASFSSRPSGAKAAGLTALFRGVNAHLRSLGVEYTLAYGTLLGWYRERGLLPHDRDVDFAALATDYPRIAGSAHLLPRGFRMYDTSPRHFGPKLYIAHQHWEADIYFFVDRDGLLQSTERCDNPGDVAPFPRRYFRPRQATNFLGEPTFVPAEPEALLKHHYGYLGTDAVRDPVTRYFRPRNQEPKTQT